MASPISTLDWFCEGGRESVLPPADSLDIWRSLERRKCQLRVVWMVMGDLYPHFLQLDYVLSSPM